MLAWGRGNDENTCAAAAAWFRKAAEQGHASAQNNLGFMYDRDEVAAMRTPTQIAEAQKLAREWKPKQ